MDSPGFREVPEDIRKACLIFTKKQMCLSLTPLGDFLWSREILVASLDPRKPLSMTRRCFQSQVSLLILQVYGLVDFGICGGSGL